MKVTDYFRKSRLKVKLLLLAVLPLLFMSAVLVVIATHLYQANASIGTLYSDRIVPLQLIKQVSDAYAIDLVDTSNKRLTGTISRDVALASLKQSHNSAAQAWQEYLQTRLVVEEQHLIREAAPRLIEAAALLHRIEHAIDNEDPELLQQIISQQMYPVVDSLSQALKQLSAIQLAEARRIFEDNQQNLYKVYWFSAFLVLAVLLLSVVLIRSLSTVTMQSVSAATRSTAALFTSSLVGVDHQESYIPDAKSHLLETIENIRQQLGFSIEETMRLLSAIPAPVMGIWDTKGRVSSVNYAFERIFALPREAVVGQQIENLPLWPENEAMYAIKSHLKAAREGSSAVYQIQLEINQAQWGSRLFFITMSSWRQNKQAVTLMLFEDVTAWHKRELWLSNKVSRDPLTQLLNRDGFNQVIEDLWFRWKTYEEPFALVMVDLNDFKAINDTYGHVVGDGVLKEFANRLQLSVRKTDICVRWGGDEFVIILTDCHSLQAVQLQTARIAESLEVEVSVQQFQQQIHASFGCIHVIEAATLQVSSIDELMHLADTRMYAAKRHTKQQTV